MMPLYNPVEYRDSYEKPSGSLWRYRKDDTNDNMIDFEILKLQSILTNNTDYKNNAL